MTRLATPIFFTAWTASANAPSLDLAKALNCRQAAFDSCDSCLSCLKTDHRNHPDVETVEADGAFIRIDAVKGLQERMKFKPMEGRKRIALIWMPTV
jgi:DNA polymerase-3 subunit delta'